MSEELVELLDFSPKPVRLQSHEKLIHQGWVYCETKRSITQSDWDKFIALLGSERIDFRFVVYQGVPGRLFGAQMLLSPEAAYRYTRYNNHQAYRKLFDAAYQRGWPTTHYT